MTVKADPAGDRHDLDLKPYRLRVAGPHAHRLCIVPGSHMAISGQIITAAMTAIISTT
jgi:hypothetical protein